MALTKIGKEGITGISNASDATAITIGSDENVGIGLASTSGVRLEVKTTSSDHLVARFENSHASGSYGISVKAGDDSGNYPADFANKSGTSLMRIRGDGNVGIGTTSPDHSLLVRRTDGDSKVLELSTGDSTATMNFSRDGNPTAFIKMFEDGSSGTGALIFGTGSSASPAERMRIASDGAVHIRSTNTPSATVGGFMFSSDQFYTSAGNTTNTNTQIRFINGNGLVGSVTVGGSSTAFNTSSDYRLKENVDYTWDATARLKQLKPARFNFITDDTNTLIDGFLAHEVSSIVPEAITGTKDAMTAQVLYAEGDELPDGKSVGDVKEPSVIKPQGIDQSKLVPLLVKTIQELEARITALEA